MCVCLLLSYTIDVLPSNLVLLMMSLLCSLVQVPPRQDGHYHPGCFNSFICVDCCCYDSATCKGLVPFQDNG